MFRLILGVASIFALAWWKRNIIQAFFEDWYSREVEITIETKSAPATDQTDSELIEETEPVEDVEIAEETEPAKDITVYVTTSGTRYHQAGCRSIKGDAEAMPLSEVAGQYKPCSRCNPSV